MIKLFARSQIISHDEVVTVYREGPVTYVDGKPVKHGANEFQIRANVQPIQGRDLLLVPEADRFKENYFVWTETLMLVNDRVVREMVNFQVQEVQTWGSFYQLRMMRTDVGPYATP